jgi:hypothetical protein
MYRRNKERYAVSTQADNKNRSEAAQGFLIQDVLSAIGILAVIFGLTPVIAFYLLIAN